MTRKQYTREFKLPVVQAAESSELRPAQACREYQLAESVLARWRQEYWTRREAAFLRLEPSPTDLYEQRIAELERVSGKLAIENAALKKPCSLSSRDETHAHDRFAPGIPNSLSAPTLPPVWREPLVGLRAFRRICQWRAGRFAPDAISPLCSPIR